MNEEEIETLARTIFGEARGENLSGQEAIASVVLNRVKIAQEKGRYWWGNSIKEVCLKPWQFSCWNSGDPNYQLLHQNLSGHKSFMICRRIALRAIGGVLKDRTYGATHYHVRCLRPRWSIGKIPCAEIGNHIFYNDIEKGVEVA